MKILFVIKHPAALRSLDSVLRMLDERGHRVHLAFGGIKPDAHVVLQRLADECRDLTFGSLPSRDRAGSRDGARWNPLAKELRAGADYLRYLEPAYSSSSALRERAEARAPSAVRRTAAILRPAGLVGVRALRRLLEHAEACLEPPAHVSRFLADFDPDVLVVTNLARESTQVDYVRAAKRLGIHTLYPVFSWDNLTNKGLVHELPELVLVWNDLQKAEAVELHGIPGERVRVLGAWSYDHWFDWRPTRSREEFCAEVGLRPDRPIVLYVCSSEFVAPDEAAFVRRWIQALRAYGAPLAEAGVLVRPHPRNSSRWRAVSLDDPQARVWPRLGEEPLEPASRGNYYDSIHHSAAVVGINTSAQIESAVVGRPVHTVLAGEFRDTQQGTLHFQYLSADDFGHLHVGETMDQHLDQLAASLRGEPDDGRNERFLRRFVRPLGLDVAAGPLYVDAVETLATTPGPDADRGPRLAPAARLPLAPLAARARRQTDRLRKKRPTPQDDLRTLVRRLRHDQAGSRVVAGPWLGGEIDELLYWIPFLRWVQLATFGLRDRLVVVARPGSAPWYAGIGAECVIAEEEQVSAPPPDIDVVHLAPALVEERRGELAAEDPHANFLRRRLEFAPLVAPELPAGTEVPEEFVAVRLAPEHGALQSALSAQGAVVPLDGLDRGSQTAVLTRAGGLVCSYGVETYMAVLLGVPAVALTPGFEESAEQDLRLVSSYLASAPFGRLHLVDSSGGADQLAERALRLLESPAGALANV